MGPLGQDGSMGHTQTVTQCFIAAPASWPLFIFPVQQFSSCWPCWDTGGAAPAAVAAAALQESLWRSHPRAGAQLCSPPPAGWLMLGHWDLLGVSRVRGALGHAGAALAHRKPHTVGRDVQLAEQVGSGALWMCRISPGLPLLKLFGLFVVLPSILAAQLPPSSLGLNWVGWFWGCGDAAWPCCHAGGPGGVEPAVSKRE